MKQDVIWFKNEGAKKYKPYLVKIDHLITNGLTSSWHKFIFIANDCSVNLSDLSKMVVNKQMKYFDVPLETLDHAWKVSVLQELVNSRTQNLYVEGFDDYVFTGMINMLCNE